MIKNNNLLKEYSEKVIQNTIERWKREKSDLDDSQARAIINRFDQVKQGLSSKLDVLNLSDELRKGNSYLNIDKYSLIDMVNLLRSIPEKEDKIKKEASKKFSGETGIPETTTRSYVARFFTNKENLKFAAKEGNEQFSKEEVLHFIPKFLQRNEMFLDPRNWKWEAFEQMMDALYPSQGVAGEDDDNYATTDADKIYDKNGLEIYKGDDVNKCISYSPRLDSGKKKYGWCVTTPGNTNYDFYRFEERSPTFYFVFDRNKPSEPDHSPFTDKWHAFVVQVNKNPKQDETYRITSANNDADTKASKWENIQKIVPPDTWERIKGLKDYFKPIDLSPVERGRKFASGKNLSLDEFKELSTEEKILYIQGKASKNQISTEIMGILPKIKIPLEGRSTTLANVAIDSGQEFPYSILKQYEALAKRYAIYRFRHTDYSNSAIPLPYVKYLDDAAKEKYINEYDSKLNYDYILKFFGEEQLNKYVDKKSKELDIIYPEKYINYIQDSNKKNFYKLYNKLLKNWEISDTFGLSEEQLENTKEAPEQNVTPKPLFLEDIKELSPKEIQSIIDIAKKFKGEKYTALLYALPYVVNDNGEDLLLIPIDEETDKWYLVNKNGMAVEKLSGDSKLNGDELNGGFPDIDRMDKYYSSDDLELQTLKENKYSFLAEIKVEKPDPKKYTTIDNNPFDDIEDLENSWSEMESEVEDRMGEIGTITNKKLWDYYSNNFDDIVNNNFEEKYGHSYQELYDYFDQFRKKKFKPGHEDNNPYIGLYEIKIDKPLLKTNWNQDWVIENNELVTDNFRVDINEFISFNGSYVVDNSDNKRPISQQEVDNILDIYSQLFDDLEEIKIEKPKQYIFATVNSMTREEKDVKVLGLIGEGDFGKAWWCEYPKGKLDILIYDIEEDNYSTNHDLGLEELLPEFTLEEPNQLYRNALSKYKLRPNKYFEDEDEDDNLHEQFLIQRLQNRAGLR